MAASLLGGYLYTYNSAAPWLFVSIVTVICIALSALYVRDPLGAEA